MKPYFVALIMNVFILNISSSTSVQLKEKELWLCRNIPQMTNLLKNMYKKQQNNPFSVILYSSLV